MKSKHLVIGAAVVALTPTLAGAQVAPGNGQNMGQGYNHMNSGNAFGQPNQSCELILDSGGSTPGNSANAPGGGSPFSGEDSTGGSHYAGSQPQNQRNTASISQYDVACANQPH